MPCLQEGELDRVMRQVPRGPNDVGDCMAGYHCSLLVCTHFISWVQGSRDIPLPLPHPDHSTRQGDLVPWSEGPLFITYLTGGVVASELHSWGHGAGCGLGAKAACGHHLAGWVLGAVGRPQLLPCSTCLLHFLQSIDPGQQFTWENSNLEVNKPKNRYANVIAYDHSRVILTSIDGEPRAAPPPIPLLSSLLAGVTFHPVREARESQGCTRAWWAGRGALG